MRGIAIKAQVLSVKSPRAQLVGITAVMYLLCSKMDSSLWLVESLCMYYGTKNSGEEEPSPYVE